MYGRPPPHRRVQHKRKVHAKQPNIKRIGDNRNCVYTILRVLSNTSVYFRVALLNELVVYYIIIIVLSRNNDKIIYSNRIEDSVIQNLTFYAM